MGKPPEWLQKIEALYAELPQLNCQGKCQESCGPIVMTKLEWGRIKKRLGCEPRIDLEKDLTCPMLNKSTGKCTVYHIRPMICRLFGLVETMKCPWGCVPERWLLREEGHAFLRKMEAINGQA